MCSRILEITDLQIFPSKRENSNLRAFCKATFNHSLVVAGIRIKEGKKGIYVAFPLQSAADGKKKFPMVYPASGDARKEISNRILATYVVNHCVDEYDV